MESSSKNEHLDDVLFRSANQMGGADNYNDWVFSLFCPILRGRILEVGCGVGTFTRRILSVSSSFDYLLSVDILPDSIKYCRANIVNPRVEFRCADITDVHGEFDSIVCMNVIEHIEDDLKALEHMIVLLRNQGVLFVLVPAHRWLFCNFDRQGGHYRRYNKSDVACLFRGAAGRLQYKLSQRYFNLAGAMGYCMVYKVLRRNPRETAGSEIGFFDRLIVPIWRRLERPWVPMGISVVAFFTKG